MDSFSAHSRLFGRVLIAAIATIGFAGFATGQDANEVFGDWQLLCEDDDCLIRQGLANPDRPRVVYSTEFQFPERADTATMTLSFPLGIYLPPGVGLRIGAETRDVPMAVCLPTGCKAIVELDGRLLSALRSGQEYKLRFYINAGTPNELTFSLGGFADAYRALEGRR